MRVLIPNNRLRQSLEDDRVRKKQYGADMAKKIHLRLESLAGAEKLSDFWPPYDPPERLHELRGAMAGVFSVDLKHPYRLLFRAVGQPDGAEQRDLSALGTWQTIDTIEVIGIEDTHA